MHRKAWTYNRLLFGATEKVRRDGKRSRLRYKVRLDEEIKANIDVKWNLFTQDRTN